ncbi:MAG TPA: alpha/beta fold hydrolase [Solirubrobacteraceae bacterium]|nr:alpha/beta fold hydrolase [Solirubrobacteraceae bacterium]
MTVTRSTSSAPPDDATRDRDRAHGEQSRARYPDAVGHVERDGVQIFWERYGDGGPTVLLLPTWSIVHSRFWKFQIPDLARRCRVVTFDGRGNGRSDRPAGAEANGTDEFAADALAVMDATATQRATLVALSCGALWGTILAANHPERVDGIVYIGPAVRLAPGYPERDMHPFDERLDTDEGWAKYNSHYWKRDYLGFLEFFFGKCFNEPHSTKHIEDSIGWALETTPETLADTTRGIGVPRGEDFRAMCARVRCPALVIHGDGDQIRPLAQGAALAEATAGRLVTLEGAGHLPSARDPVKVNLLLRDFISPPPPARRWTRAPSRRRRALYISSPIGLGHVRRDLAIAQELRRLRPDLEIEWLAQDPVSEVLEAHGERIHPSSVDLAGESSHIQSEAVGEHELNVFQAFRRMDEILVANFMVFHDLIRDEQCDLWIGDEAWELDYFLHENPELKSAAYVWLSDFVGWLPMHAGGEGEASLTRDYNAEMIEQIARYPRVRDLSLFVGDPEDVVPGVFGTGLPSIREWTDQHFAFTGYITGFDPETVADREALRAELGYGEAERVCIATVGGSGVGEHLLARVIASYPEAKRLVPGLRMIVVAGPRIDPAALPAADGLEVRSYVPDLYRHLAACDLAIVQGGLSTTMELTATRRPFIYFPLERHFEQNLHVRHRLERHGAGRRMAYRSSSPKAIAAAIGSEIGRQVDYRPVATDGATRAAELIVELL